jgi:aryl-alcohol dehydrogenase-like predicted oxidoreductase
LAQGDSEELPGKWPKRNPSIRKEIFLSTKFGFDMDNNWQSSGDPKFVHKEFANSIKKLGVPYIDLYYLHRPDPKTPIELTVGVMAELFK